MVQVPPAETVVAGTPGAGAPAATDHGPDRLQVLVAFGTAATVSPVGKAPDTATGLAITALLLSIDSVHVLTSS